MIDLTIRQAIDLWAELEDAYQGVNTYAGDESYVYAYKLQQSRPSGQDQKSLTRTAQSLQTICCLFANKRQCRVFVDGVDVFEGDVKPFDSRVHVRVEKTWRGQL